MDARLENLLCNIAALCKSLLVMSEGIARADLGDQQVQKLQGNIATLCQALLVLSGNATGAEFSVSIGEGRFLCICTREIEGRQVAGMFRLSASLQERQHAG